jgi:hypothetical protein
MKDSIRYEVQPIAHDKVKVTVGSTELRDCQGLTAVSERLLGWIV